METILKSPTKIVTIGPNHPLVIIGERINPTGRKKLAQALEQRNLKSFHLHTLSNWLSLED